MGRDGERTTAYTLTGGPALPCGDDAQDRILTRHVECSGRRESNVGDCCGESGSKLLRAGQPRAPRRQHQSQHAALVGLGVEILVAGVGAVAGPWVERAAGQVRDGGAGVEDRIDVIRMGSGKGELSRRVGLTGDCRPAVIVLRVDAADLVPTGAVALGPAGQPAYRIARQRPHVTHADGIDR